jgi:hypothetical protein
MHNLHDLLWLFFTREGKEYMRTLFELLWLVLTIVPVVLLSIRTRAARRKVKRSDRAWKMVERYIF